MIGSMPNCDRFRCHFATTVQEVLPVIFACSPTAQLLVIKTLSMDMNVGYIRATRIHLPNVVEQIDFDHFHVAKQLVEVMDKTRQNEHPHLPVESRRQAKGTRFWWQYSDKWMTESRQEKLIWQSAQMKLTS